jgi:hypothetical protein
VLAKYYPQTKPGYCRLGMAGGIIIVEATASQQHLTRAKLISSLESLGHFAPGVVPPIDWSAAYHGGPKAFGYAQWKGGKLAVLQGW